MKGKIYLETLTLVWEARKAVGDDAAAAQTPRDYEITPQSLEPDVKSEGAEHYWVWWSKNFRSGYGCRFF